MLLASRLGAGWVVLPVMYSSRQSGGKRSIRLPAWACVGEAIPQTVTEGVFLNPFTALATVPIYMIESLPSRGYNPPENARGTDERKQKERKINSDLGSNN